MTQAEQLARFVVGASYSDLSEHARDQLKLRILDSLACAIGALEGEPVRILRTHLEELDGAGHSALIGAGRTSPDRAALYNGTLVRYLDFNDSFIAPKETCHPSDNLAAILAASEYRGGSGRDVLVALAVAYQVQCRLSEVAPVRARGFDHVTQLAYSVAAGVSKALGLDVEHATNAVAISGTAFNALRVTRTGALSHWKGLAAPNAAWGATHSAFLAMRGITGPPGVFEGNKGFMDSIAGRFDIDWSKEDLERVTRTSIKKYNAEFHSQSTIEAALSLKRDEGVRPEDIEAVDIETFDVAFHIIGGGEEGGKHVVETKEEADHSLPYMVAVALLDDEVMPAQYKPSRIRAPDVQDLLSRVNVRPKDEYSRRFPEEMPSRVTLRLRDGRELSREQRDYEGFYTRPMSWEVVREKMRRLAGPYASENVQDEIAEVVFDLERASTSQLMRHLRRVEVPRHRS